MNINTTIQNKDYTEDHTNCVLRGIPLFCANRQYINNIDTSLGQAKLIKNHYIFRFSNNFGASVVEFVDRLFDADSADIIYELAVIKFSSSNSEELSEELYDLDYTTGITEDVERCNAKGIDNFLNMIEKL